MTGSGGLSRRTLVTGGLAITSAALAACRSPSPAGSSSSRTTGVPAAGEVGAAPDASPAAPPPDPAEIRADELGVVPVMMYHRITATVRSEYDATPADFRRQLHRMFAAGYRPARTIDLVRGQFRVAAGYTPVVLTFDDGYEEQFRVSPSGEVDPESAAGILLDVCREFPDCPPAGSFNINKNPFGLTDPARQQHGLRTLHELGFEIANHTFDHDNLARLDAASVQRDFVRLQQLVERAVPGASVLTMALPFGVEPRDRALAASGAWGGQRYTNEGVLLVGANPSPSPFSASFDPHAIPRIRSTSWRGGGARLTARYWLDRLDAHRVRRYVSAGRPGRVTAPRTAAGLVAPRWRDRLDTY